MRRISFREYFICKLYQSVPAAVQHGFYAIFHIWREAHEILEFVHIHIWREAPNIPVVTYLHLARSAKQSWEISLAA
jgi:hypothetical protein